MAPYESAALPLGYTGIVLWQARLDSNQGLRESKSRAFGQLGYALMMMVEGEELGSNLLRIAHDNGAPPFDRAVKIAGAR